MNDKKLMAYFLHIVQEEDGEQRATLDACIDDSREFALIVVSHDDRFMDLNDASAPHDPNNNSSGTAIKCRQLEKLCIANYCDILCLCKEIPGRKYDKNKFILWHFQKLRSF